MAGDVLRSVWIIRQRSVIHVYGKRNRPIRFGYDVSRETFAIQHLARVEPIFRSECAGLGKNMPCSRRIHLDFRQRSVFSEDRQSGEELGKVRTRLPVRQIVTYEIGAEQVCPIAACPVTL